MSESAPPIHTASEHLKRAIRDIHDFPRKGIIFKDITPILQDAGLFTQAVNLFVEANRGRRIDKVVGIDARGFLFGAAAAYAMGAGFVPVRKKGKLPAQTRTASYTLEYGEATVEIHCDAITPGERVVLIDDLLATGGTAAAAVALLGELKADLVETQFLIELGFLNGRERMGSAPVRSFISF